MTRLVLTLLGSLSIILDDRPVKRVESDKVRALLVRLALEPERAFRRETLSTLLWPQATPAHASQNLRQALYNLRHVLGEDLLLVTPQTIQLNMSERISVDVWTWRQLWDETQKHRHRRRESCRFCLKRLAQAVALYHGDLLAGFSLKNCPEFEDWITFERERLYVQALQAIAELARAAERNGDLATAQAYLRRYLTLEPWQEEVHRQLMRLLTLEGRRVAAIEQFDVANRA